MSHTPGPQKFSRADLTARLRKLEARELPKPILVNTSISLHSDVNACIAGFVMGGGFTLEAAQEIARRCNAHEELLAVLVGFEDLIRKCVSCDGSGEHPRRKGESCAECGGVGEVFSIAASALIGDLRAAIAKARGGR